MTEAKVLIVTGASSGLGRATAEVFARAGWNVALAARRAEPLREAAATLAGAPGKALAVPTDVAAPEQVRALVDRAFDAFGRVDVLVNNAAIDRPGPIESLTPERWNEVVGVNLTGVYLACRAVWPAMRRQGGGLIVNVSSVAGKRGWADAAAYCATKFALAGLTQALGAEGAPHGIRCSVLYPGGMDTGWHGQPRPEFLDPAEVGRFILDMASRDGGFVVNEAIVTPVGEKGWP